MIPRSRTVIQYSDSLGYGGMEQIVEGLMRGLPELDWRPILMIHEDAGAAPLLKSAAESGIRVEVARSIRGRHAPRGFADVAVRLAHLRPAVFHAHMAWQRSSEYGRIAAAMAGVPATVATAHLYLDAPGLRERVTPSLTSIVTDRYVAVSSPIATMLTNRFKIASHKVDVIENGIDALRYHAPRNLDMVDRLRAGRTHAILTVSQLREQKGHLYLVDAIAAGLDASFIFVGDGPQRAAVEQRAHDLGVADRIQFLGFRSDVPELLAAADVFVLPSLAEGLPLVLLEAMAAGTPVVATSVGGIPDAIRDGHSGLLVSPRDPAALARAITRLLEDNAFARQLANNARQSVLGRFSVGTMVDRYAALYERVAGSATVRRFPRRP